VAFARGCFPRNLGITISMTLPADDAFAVDALAIKERLFSEIASSVIATCNPEKLAAIRALLGEHPGVFAATLGHVTTGNYTIVLNEQIVIDESIQSLKNDWSTALESQLAAEVLV